MSLASPLSVAQLRKFRAHANTNDIVNDSLKYWFNLIPDHCVSKHVWVQIFSVVLKPVLRCVRTPTLSPADAT